MMQNLMDRHGPLAVAEDRRLHDLDVGNGALADTTKIEHSDVTGKEALLKVLRTINTQFDDLLNASYHQDGQKLLATNRYLQQRFNNPTSNSRLQQIDNSAVEVQAIENPANKETDVEDIKL